MEAARKWDAELGFGVLLGSGNDHVIGAGTRSAGLGYFWNPHLRTSVAVSTVGLGLGTGSTEYLPQESRHTLYSPKRATLSEAVTYQFRDNVFLHPFVSAGVHVGWHERQVQHWTGTGASSRVVIDGPFQEKQVRPVVSAGMKTHFSDGRVFARPEVAFLPGSDNTLRTMLRVGFGVDF